LLETLSARQTGFFYRKNVPEVVKSPPSQKHKRRGRFQRESGSFTVKSERIITFSAGRGTLGESE